MQEKLRKNRKIMWDLNLDTGRREIRNNTNNLIEIKSRDRKIQRRKRRIIGER